MNEKRPLREAKIMDVELTSKKHRTAVEVLEQPPVLETSSGLDDCASQPSIPPLKKGA